MVTGLLGGGSWIFSQGIKGSPRSLGKERKKRNQWSRSWGLEGADNSKKKSPSGRCCSCLFFSVLSKLKLKHCTKVPTVEECATKCQLQLVIIEMPSVEMSACVSKKLVDSRKHLSLDMRFSKTMDSQNLGTRMAGDYASPVPGSNPTQFILAPGFPLSTCRSTSFI